jgi:integrase
LALYRQAKSKFWWTRFTVDGIPIRQSTKCLGKTAAQTFEDDLRRQLMERGGLLPRRMKTLAQYEPEFFQEIRATVENNELEAATETYYKVGWNVLKDTELAKTSLDRITTAKVSSCKFGLSATHRNNALRTLSRMLSVAVDLGYIRVRPKIKLAKEQRREQLIEQWMEEKLLEVTALTRTPLKKHSPIKGVNYGFQPLRDVLLIMLDSGMRPAEIFRMRWEHVLWQRGSICVPHGKSEAAARFVPLSGRIQKALLARAMPELKEQHMFQH